MITTEILKNNIKDIEDTGDILSAFYFISSTEIRTARDRTIVAKNGREVIGAIQLSKKLDKVNLLVVKKNWRREGIGKLLFAEAIKVFELKKLICVATLWPSNSTNFWTAVGFVPTGKLEQTKKGNWMLEMSWRLEDD